MQICPSEVPTPRKPQAKDEGKGWKLMFSPVIPGYYLYITGPNLRDWPSDYRMFPQYTRQELELLRDASRNGKVDKRSMDCNDCQFDEGWGDDEQCTINHNQFVHAAKTMFPGSKIVK